MVWEHGAYVLVSLGLPDTKEVRGVEGQDGSRNGGRERRSVWCCSLLGQGMGGEFGS